MSSPKALQTELNKHVTAFHAFAHLSSIWEHFMGHCSNSLISGTTKQRSAQQKYQFAKIKAAHHTSDENSNKS